MNGRDFIIKFNAYELGILAVVIMQSDDISQLALKPVFDQLIDIKKKCESDAGVKKEIIPGGMLKLTDKYGNMITRAPYPWEVEGN